MTYDLRRLRLHGLIERMAHSHRYRVTPIGMKVSLFFTKVYQRVMTNGLAQCFDDFPQKANRPIVRALDQLDACLCELVREARIMT